MPTHASRRARTTGASPIRAACVPRLDIVTSRASGGIKRKNNANRYDPITTTRDRNETVCGDVANVIASNRRHVTTVAKTSILTHRQLKIDATCHFRLRRAIAPRPTGLRKSSNTLRSSKARLHTSNCENLFTYASVTETHPHHHPPRHITQSHRSVPKTSSSPTASSARWGQQ